MAGDTEKRGARVGQGQCWHFRDPGQGALPSTTGAFQRTVRAEEPPFPGTCWAYRVLWWESKGDKEMVVVQSLDAGTQHCTLHQGQQISLLCAQETSTRTHERGRRLVHWSVSQGGNSIAALPVSALVLVRVYNQCQTYWCWTP